ncbi:MAG TPA: MraY family glycosyltransferase [Thermoanaerobaculaceae bacterium]|nr:MraY family glycosyltransferase [Thermoanaerobaculaceae bacterium]
MLDVTLYAGFAAIIAGVVTGFMVPFVTKAAFAVRAVDYPGGRKFHGGAIPRLGGVAIVFGIAFGAGSVALARWSTWGGRISKAELVAFAIATGMVFTVGLVDDIVGVSVAKKFLVELVAAILIVYVGWWFSGLGLPGGVALELGVAGGVVTVLWIVGVANAINLFDGLDGLAGGVVAIVAGSVLIYSVIQGNLLTVILMGAVVGACLGFLPHNRLPAKIFMGDAGALTLGFLLGAISVHSSLKSPMAIAILIPVLALGVPVMDTLVVMAVRFLERPKGHAVERLLRVFRADRNHVHQLMQRHGASRPLVVRTLYLLVLLSCAMAAVVALTKSPGLGISLVIVEIGAILLIRTLGFARSTRALADEQREELREKWFAPARPQAEK